MTATPNATASKRKPVAAPKTAAHSILDREREFLMNSLRWTCVRKSRHDKSYVHKNHSLPGFERDSDCQRCAKENPRHHRIQRLRAQRREAALQWRSVRR